LHNEPCVRKSFGELILARSHILSARHKDIVETDEREFNLKPELQGKRKPLK
jgi:hypothetical protein